MFNTAHCVSILPQADKCGTCDKNVSNDCRADCSKAWGGAAKKDKVSYEYSCTTRYYQLAMSTRVQLQQMYM